MKKSVIGMGCIYAVLFSMPAFAQYGSDIFRYSEINQTGSARFQAIGGNHAALGADPSNISGNPAGLGFYNRSEFSFSPGYTSVSNKASYIGNAVTTNSNRLNLSQASLVLASQPGFQRKWKRSAFGVSFSRQQTFNEVYDYSGLNNRSAYVDKVIEDVNRGTGVSSAQLDADFDPGSSGVAPLAYTLPAAYYQMYLINPTTQTGPPYYALDNTSATNQVGSYTATGANSQWNLSYGGNYDDKLYVGGTFSFNKIRYTYDRTFHDNYVNSPELISVTQGEGLTVNGNGINLSAGVIYKFNPAFQLGGVITSPTWSAIKETFSQSVDAKYVDGKLTNPDGDLINAPYNGLDVAPNDFVYSMTGPLRASFGATFFVKKSGFITASAEYVGYGAMGAGTSYLSSEENRTFKSDTKDEVKNTYRNTVNVKVGGEYRAGKFRARAGVGYNADPYLQRANIDRSRLLTSAGLGVRSDRFYLDLTGTISTYKSIYTPYYLNNDADYSSVNVSNRTVNAVLTFGVLF